MAVIGGNLFLKRVSLNSDYSDIQSEYMSDEEIFTKKY